MIRTGGNWNPEAWPIYFVASEPKTLAHAYTVNRHLLVAVNEIHADEHFDMLETFIAAGTDVFIDSGVYNLATRHAHAHRMSMDRALSLAPDDIDDFTELFDKYVTDSPRRCEPLPHPTIDGADPCQQSQDDRADECQ
jgi:hypothetical protein